MASVRAAQRGDRETAETLCGRGPRRGASVSATRTSYTAQIVCVTRANLAFSIGAVHEAATHTERSTEIAGPPGRRLWLGDSGLNGAATLYAMADDADAALPLATEGLALARRLGIPSLIAMNLARARGRARRQRPPARPGAIARERRTPSQPRLRELG